MLPAAQERVSYLEGKMDEMSNTLTRVEGLLTSLDHKFMSLDQKVDRRFDSSFMWMFGVQVTTLLTLVAGLFTIIAKLL